MSHNNKALINHSILLKHTLGIAYLSFDQSPHSTSHPLNSLPSIPHMEVEELA